MKRITAFACTVLFATGLLTNDATAQISGSINRNAPKVTQMIAMGDNKIEVNYTSIRFGEGMWQKILENEDMHERFNAGAERRPIGMVKSSVDVVAAGKAIPAGEYKMFFTVNAQAGWILNLKSGDDEAIRWRLVLKDMDKKSNCMKITLEPSAEDGQCSLTIAFGKQMVSVPVMAGGEDK